MDPVGIIPQYFSVTSGIGDGEKLSVIRKAVLIAGIVLLFFILMGKTILGFFGITPGAFYISGGILFFMIAFEMIYSKPKMRSTPADTTERPDTSAVALFPLAIPMIAGPGMMTTIMLQVTRNIPTLQAMLPLIAAVMLSLAIVYVTLRASTLLLRVLGRTGVFVVEKIMGLILAGMAVQLIYDGLNKLGLAGNIL
jgi:multiple antibiotic resistance protein